MARTAVGGPVSSSALTSNYQNYPLNSRNNCFKLCTRCHQTLRIINSVKLEYFPEIGTATVSIKIFCYSPIQHSVDLFGVISFHSVNANERHEMSIIEAISK